MSPDLRHGLERAGARPSAAGLLCWPPVPLDRVLKRGIIFIPMLALAQIAALGSFSPNLLGLGGDSFVVQ